MQRRVRAPWLKGARWPQLLLILAWLPWTACEAAYDLAEIEAERAKALRRTDDLQAAALSKDEIVLVGGHGLVVSSSDGGESFERSDLEGWPALIDVTACPDGSFAALDFRGQVLVRDATPGSAWQTHTLPGPDIGMAITCDPSGRLWVVGEFTSLRSSIDRGESWDERTFDRDAIFTAIVFVDANVGFIAGEFGSFLSTENGGRDWSWRPTFDEEFYPQSAVFRDASEGWLVGLSGTIFRTTDGGETWDRESAPVESPLFFVTLHSDRPVAVGGLGTLLVRDSGWRIEAVEPQVFGVLTVARSLPDGRLLLAGSNGQVRLVELASRAAQR